MCVVKTVEARTSSSAAGKESPRSSTSARARSRPRKAACPSFMWKTVGLEPELAQRPHAADAEHELLADPVLTVAAVQHVGHLGLEQVEAHAADVRAPDPGGDRLAGELDRDRDRLEHEAEPLRVELRVARLLPVVLERLLEVALPVEQADSDQRDAEVGGRLEVVAGEDPEPARVDRERLAQPELRREVRDEEAGFAVRPLPPGHRLPFGTVKETTGETDVVPSRFRAIATSESRSPRW